MFVKMAPDPYCFNSSKSRIDGLMQERRNSIANTLELSLSLALTHRYSDIDLC